jgi:hypothetical protein
MPSNVGGLDIHRKQITFDYLDLVTGEVKCGQVTRLTGSISGPGWPGSSVPAGSRSR